MGPLNTYSIYTYRKWIEDWGFLSTRKQGHNEETIQPWVEDVKQRFPTKGAEGIKVMLSLNHGVKAPRELILRVLHTIESEAVAVRKAKKFKHRIYYAAGVSNMWCLDQHDKFQKFGLRFHNAINPFSSRNIWVKCWWTNKNPILINSYYLEAVKQAGDAHCAGYVPLTLMSDPGKKNIKSEINWSIYRRDFAPGFEELFNRGLLSGLYNPDKNLEYLVFRQIAIPFMQKEYCHKVLPHGIPALINKFPHLYGAQDFRLETTHNASLSIEVNEFWRHKERVDAETVNLLEGQQELRYDGTVIGEAGLRDEEIANPFFRHDSENYLEVDFTDNEEEGEPLEVLEFTDDLEEEGCRLTSDVVTYLP
ncbi:hypothetical protein BDP27DRAFT_1372793 [Rhodocollybia butyracea]|uniref:Uncharacterized protein n=1 Tax=Rhodocollybia butyracea TaxID=206335 RepID=A0A9P5TX17_9AGAR|nr:hypothetical protein BDP27DRAFT_1372793 [Rhodocollybia butyracea]